MNHPVSKLIRDYLAVKLLMLSMFIASREMSTAIALGLFVSFPALRERLQKELNETAE